MKVIPPIDLQSTMVTSSTVSEPDAGETAWSATELVAESERRYLGTISGTVTISNASPAIFTQAANVLAEGTPITLTTDGTLPAPFVVGTVYFVRRRLTSSTFTVAAAAGGTALNSTTSGSGTHTLTAQVHRVYESLIPGSVGVVTISDGAGVDPATITFANHGYEIGDTVSFTATVSLPPGINSGTTYYLISTGFMEGAFQVSLTAAGTGTITNGSGSGTLECGPAGSYNKPPLLNPTVWSDVGGTNKYAALDLERSVATTGESPLTIELTPGERVNSIGIMSIDATDISVTVTSVLNGGTIYTYTASLATREVTGWYDYFFASFVYRESLALFDLPPCTDGVITVTVTRDGGGAVSIGGLALGMFQSLGDVEAAPTSDTLNFSRITRDEYGEATLVPRRNIPKNSYSILFEKTQTNKLRAVRDALNAKPAVWAGEPDNTDGWFEALLIVGIYKRFALNLAPRGFTEHGILELELEEI